MQLWPYTIKVSFLYLLFKQLRMKYPPSNQVLFYIKEKPQQWKPPPFRTAAQCNSDNKSMGEYPERERESVKKKTSLWKKMIDCWYCNRIRLTNGKKKEKVFSGGSIWSHYTYCILAGPQYQSAFNVMKKTGIKRSLHKGICKDMHACMCVYTQSDKHNFHIYCWMRKGKGREGKKIPHK